MCGSQGFNGIVQPTMIVLTSFTLPHVVPRMLVTKYFPIDLYFFIREMGTEAIWLPTFFKIVCSTKNSPKKIVIEFWNNMRVQKL